MRNTLPVSFNHHWNQGGRAAFREWMSEADNAHLSLEPIFRYGRSFSESVTELRRLAGSQPDLYLCNIVEHSAVLTSRRDLDSKTNLAFQYVDVDTLIETPNVTGFNVNDDLLADALKPLHGWHAICGEHSFDESSREAGLTEIAFWPADLNDDHAERTLHCHLTDPSQFAANWRNVNFIVFFVPPSISLDIPITSDRFRRNRLRNYFMRNKIPFGTMGDCHMDDDIAVAYQLPSFDFPESQRCFIR